MIQLTDIERDIIKYCKFHYKDNPEYKGKSTIMGLSVIYDKHYISWKNYKKWKHVMFQQLYDVYLKINPGDNNREIKFMFSAIFEKTLTNTKKKPIDRGLIELINYIAFTKVYDGDKQLFDIK